MATRAMSLFLMLGLLSFAASSARAQSFCDGNGVNDGLTVDCPCGNHSVVGEGCRNSVALGAVLQNTGGTSVGNPDTVLATEQMPPDRLGFTYFGPTPFHNGSQYGVVINDGIRCLLAGGTSRLDNFTSDSNGAFKYAASDLWAHPQAAWITSGSTWYFQTWYRDGSGPCGTGSNVSNGLAITFTP